MRKERAALVVVVGVVMGVTLIYATLLAYDQSHLIVTHASVAEEKPSMRSSSDTAQQKPKSNPQPQPQPQPKPPPEPPKPEPPKPPVEEDDEEPLPRNRDPLITWIERKPGTLLEQYWKALDATQFPPPETCRNITKLHFKNTKSGLGSAVHAFSQCVYQAHYTNTTCVFRPSRWRYASGPECAPHHDFACLFESFSGCEMTDTPFVQFDRQPYLRMRDSLIRNRTEEMVFNDAEAHLASIGAHRWRWSATVAYLFRPNNRTKAEIMRIKREIGYGTDDFTIGLNVRRGDIDRDGRKPVPLSEFMVPVEAWLEKQPGYTNRSTVGIFVATTDRGVIEESKAFPRYRWMINVPNERSWVEADTPYVESIEIIKDFVLVSSADFASVSGNSNMGHLVAELMVAWRDVGAVGNFCMLNRAGDGQTVCSVVNYDD